MKNALIAATLSTMALAGAPAARSESITVSVAGSAASVLADPKNFTGSVVVDMLLPTSLSTPASSALVSFAPGARTAWHSHPLGQMLIVTAGKGWVHQEGQERQEIRQGETVWIPAGMKHWHGATAQNAMSHYAITYIKDGKNAEWMELVSDEQYQN
ncbi:cupin domain-containing protein [Neorhizobium sp. T6_25]|jgi:quercetin dioxygenase-like cupin family protein|uniref:(R)-mandelonitrile lyase n=1 Tax=Neorhizobium sp. T6_25 TaxID=2093833 RepID=UPI000CF8947C|nr:cupin domain-containing protein [Neorhizobium sp. T6_25]